MNIMKKRLALLLQIKNPKESFTYLLRKKEHIDLLNWINSTIIDDISLTEKIHIILNGPPTCPNMIFYKIGSPYKFCGNKDICGCKKNYYIANKDEISDKRKRTNIEKYGVEFNSQIEEVKKQKEKTFIKKYGVKTNLMDENIKEQIKQTNLSVYGTESPMQNDEIKKKIKQTNLKKYGVETNLQLPEVRDKVKKTYKKKYGTPFLGQIHFDQRTIDFLNEGKIVQYYNDHGIDGIMSSYPMLTMPTIYDNLRKHDIYINPNSSSLEMIISSFLKENVTTDIIENSKKIIPPYEIDIFLPEYDLGIEICGLYWHSENGANKTRQYHKMKLNMCNDKSIRLITIFEDEILNKLDIVKDRLLHILKKKPTTCYARNCTIAEISTSEYKKFLNTYHIQGHAPTTTKLGAYFNDSLVSVMGFGSRKITSSNQHELIRYSACGSIPGVASKLFKYYVNNYDCEQIISYCDLRWGDGNLYEMLGMEFLHISEPNYWYMEQYKNRIHRYNFPKHKLIKEGFDPDLTEWQIMQMRGYDRIWDCGNSKWLWTKNS